MQEQFIFSSITFFGVLTILFLSLISCGKGRVPTTPTKAAAKTQKPSTKNLKENDEQKSEKRKRSKKTEENSMKTQDETLKTENSQLASSTRQSNNNTVAADLKQLKSSQKKTVATTQEGSELVTQLSETIELSKTQPLSSTSNRSAKEKKHPPSTATATVTNDKKNNNNQKVDKRFVKESALTAIEPPSNRSTNTARQQQPSTRAQSTQNSTLEEQRSQKKSQKQQQQSENEVALAPTQSPAPPRDIERDKELAAKALMFIRAKRAQNAYSARERMQINEAKLSNREVKEPEIRDNPDEHAQVLTDSNEENDHPDGGNKKKSKSFPTIDTPDIIPGEKIAEEIEIEKENIEEGEKEEIKKESKKKKNIKLQEAIYVPPEKRQFRPVSEIPADDLTIKRKKKKKKKQKKKSKKSSDSSSDDNKNIK
uniref:Uncharacterized protein n=1 Tax=Panagrolaimus sp. ES5 TaxID=591445 RepID=A0AC34F3P8_9BILA